MNKYLFPGALGLIFALLVGVVVMRPLSGFYPMVQVEVRDSAHAITLDFLFERSGSQTECGNKIANIARSVLEQCPQCRIAKLDCRPNLSAEEALWLGETPLPVASGRIANGVVRFVATSEELAAAACQSSERQSASSPTPIVCHPAGSPRPKRAVSLALTDASWSAATLLLAFAGAWLTVWLILRFEHMHAHLSHDHVEGGPQKYHASPTPRIGGVAVMAGLLAAAAVWPLSGSMRADSSYGLLLVAALPAFLGGLAEDVTKRVGVLERLLLTMISGGLAAWLLGAALNRLGIPYVDEALLWLPAAVLFTAFAVGGVANAVNIIDGYNGLAATVAVLMFAAFGYVAWQLGDALLVQVCLAMIGALLGFLVWNYPRGLIFLGDGGAYLVGFVLAEVAVLLVVRQPQVSPWFGLLVCLYPVTETVFSIYRRRFVRHAHPGMPDALHLHSLIYRRLVRWAAGHEAARDITLRNSATSPYLWGLSTLSIMPAVLFWRHEALLIASALAFVAAYVWLYATLVRFRSPRWLRRRV